MDSLWSRWFRNRVWSGNLVLREMEARSVRLESFHKKLRPFGISGLRVVPSNSGGLLMRGDTWMFLFLNAARLEVDAIYHPEG